MNEEFNNQVSPENACRPQENVSPIPQGQPGPMPVFRCVYQNGIPIYLDGFGNVIPPLYVNWEGVSIPPVFVDTNGMPVPMYVDAQGLPIPTFVAPDGRRIPMCPDSHGRLVPMKMDPYGCPISPQTTKAPRKVKKKKPVFAVIFSFLVLLAALGVQVAATIPIYIVKIFQYSAENPSLLENPEGINEEELISALTGGDSLIMISAVVTAISALVFLIWYKFGFVKKYRVNQLADTCKKVFKVKSILGIVFGTISTFFLASLLSTVVGSLFPSVLEEYNELLETSFGDMSGVLAAVTVVVLAPINEELVFRGVILTYLKRNVPAIVALLITTLCFSIMHLNWMQSIYVIPAGFLFAYIAWKYDSIIPSMMAHALFNGMNYILELLPEAVLESDIFFLSGLIIFTAAWVVIERDGLKSIVKGKAAGETA